MDAEEKLAAVLGADKVSTSLLDRVAYSCDASLYQLVPRSVVRVESIADVQSLFAWSRRENIPITFRGAGTSLSGQAVTHHVLVVVRNFNDFVVGRDGAVVTAGCSLRGGYVNARLRAYHRRIGPDPASIDACTIGGIVANNASGMCCGITQNSYHTLRAMTLVLPSGTMIDTTDIAAADAQLAHYEPELYQGLATLRDEIRADRALVALIRHRSRLKNTMGFALAAFLDYDLPADILQHLMVGSEGTLGFIANVTLATIEEPPFAQTALIGFPTIADACRAVAAFDDMGATAIELMDDATLRAIQHYAVQGTRVQLPRAAGLLVEFRYADSAEAIPSTHIAHVADMCNADSVTIATNDYERLLLWKLRKGAMPSVGAARPVGSALINEDVAFPRDRLAEAVGDLRRLLDTFSFDDAVIFGHARDGNMHFAFSLVSDQRSIDTYAAFMDALAELVVQRYDGSLKAEHGTGRNMAPYLVQQWGDRATEIMWRIKRLVDPQHLLNPDVILTRDTTLHVRNIKHLPRVHPVLDHCIECGFCERVCPSATLTLSPRQRIVVLREIARCRRDNERRILHRAFTYAGEVTCAADGMCMLACPVGINTGEVIIEQREQKANGLSRIGWQLAALSPAFWIRATGMKLFLAKKIASLTGESLMERVSNIATHVARTPMWLRTMGVPERLRAQSCRAPHLTYLPTCMTCFGGRNRHGSVAEAFLHLAKQAGVKVAIPPAACTVCCGHPWHSGGMVAEYRRVASRWIAAAMKATEDGAIPLVVDSSSCALSIGQELKKMTASDDTMQVKVLDPVDAAEYLYTHGQISAPARRYRVLVHPGCAGERLGATERIRLLLERLGCQVIIPPSAACCGMAGDRGLRYPELPAHALAQQAEEIRQSDADFYVGTNLPCIWQLAHTTGKPFVHLWIALLQMAK
ncbi:MAG: FAD-binding and (Fe-S)-binding domain-containing protein [Bacteroidota bacterium]|nr:FAD-binding oxidoreductase [Candidatus Kapabacteria bacterium]MDW8270873.1 FAD-binding and (Fe-S)-binding domain-containing protein [Bacteroidota bacterium]